jgi:hypothetical protein
MKEIRGRGILPGDENETRFCKGENSKKEKEEEGERRRRKKKSKNKNN